MSSSSTSRDPLAGHLNHLTSSQEQAFTSFKALLKSRDLYTDEPTPSHDDSTILRFLRARRFDIQGAYKQFSEAEQWRKNTEVEKLYEGYDITEYDEARKVFPMWTGRQDRTGHPFYVFRVKDLDKKAMDRYNHSSPTAKNSTTDTKRPPPVVALYEHLTRLVAPLVSKRPNRPNPETPIVSSANIVDVTGVSLMQFLSLRSHLGESSGLATARYPETLNSIYVIGAPSYIEVIFSFLSQWFDPDTRAKINILPNDKTTSYRRLTEAIDPANIPKYYGGQLDWDFPDSPNLDPEINKMLGFTADDWPVGPAMLQGDDLVAVGKMKDGALRRTVVGRCGGAGAA